LTTDLKTIYSHYDVLSICQRIGGQGFLIAEKTFTAEKAENAEGFILKDQT